MMRFSHLVVSQYFFQPKFTPSFFFLHRSLVRTTAQNTSNTPCNIRRISDPNIIFQPNEQFCVAFHTQASYISFQAWLSQQYTGCQHILTIIEPAAFAMNITV